MLGAAPSYFVLPLYNLIKKKSVTNYKKPKVNVKWTYQFIVWEENSNLRIENATGTPTANIIPTAWNINPANPTNYKILFKVSTNNI